MGQETSFSQNNRIIQCACGCGKFRPRFDRKGREYCYIKGHSSRKSYMPGKVVLKAVQKYGSPNAASIALNLSGNSIKRILKKERLMYDVDFRKVGGNSSFGRIGELIALTILPGAIDVTDKDCKKAPFDILWGSKKVDVKASHQKIYKKAYRWSFKTSSKCEIDYFLCIGFENNLPLLSFLIPAKCAPNSTTIPVNGISKWRKYIFKDLRLTGENRLRLG